MKQDKINEKKIMKITDAREISETVEILKEDIVIPDIVMKKANLAFETIKKEQAGQNPRSREPQKKLSWKKVCMIAAAAALTTGAVTAGASAYMKWSKGLSEGMQATEEQMAKAEEEKLASPVNRAAEVAGIRVTAVQSIVDSHYAMISFKVDGYEELCPKGSQPIFDDCKVWVDGYNPGEEDGYDVEKNFSVSGNVYNGYVMREDGMVVKASDGTTMLEAKENGTYTCFMDDGSFEWQMVLANEEADGVFFDKDIHVELKDLGTIPKDAFVPDVEGTWSFDWILTGSEERREAELDASLGDTGSKVVYAELSPISLTLNYKCTDTTVRPPRFYGVKLKNGECWPYLFMGPGKDSVIPDENGDFYTTFALNRILDVSEVEALLFSRSQPAEGEAVEFKSLEENCYVVPLE